MLLQPFWVFWLGPWGALNRSLHSFLSDPNAFLSPCNTIISKSKSWKIHLRSQSTEKTHRECTYGRNQNTNRYIWLLCSNQNHATAWPWKPVQTSPFTNPQEIKPVPAELHFCRPHYGKSSAKCPPCTVLLPTKNWWHSPTDLETLILQVVVTHQPVNTSREKNRREGRFPVCPALSR